MDRERKEKYGERGTASRNAPPQRRQAFGCLVALSAVAGTVIGIVCKQPTIGLLSGLAIGVAACVAATLGHYFLGKS